MAMSFLGLILDSSCEAGDLPATRKLELMHKLNKWSTRCKATKCELLLLIGKLSFAVRAVPAGHLFLCHLITLGHCTNGPGKQTSHFTGPPCSVQVQFIS